MKYLNKYDSWTDYRTNVTDPNAPGVTLVENEVLINPIGQATFGDIIYFDKRDGKYKSSSKGGYTEGFYHNRTLVPIGVVVVPSRFSPDGSIRMMSLVNMSVSTPDEGTTAGGTADVENNKTNMSMFWGGNGVDLPLKNYGSTACVKVNPLTGEQTGTTDWMRIPGERSTNTGYVDPISGYRYYYKNYINDPAVSADGEDRFGPSPFLADGSKNPLFFKEGMAHNDFDGRGNTEVILAAVTEENWRTKTSITNGYAAGNYPAAECCWRYHTEGTEQGDWYLPAEGELTMIYAKEDTINNTLLAIENKGLTRAYRLPTGGTTYGDWCRSSSEYSSTNGRYVSLSYGTVNYNTKSYTTASNRVRAFSALNPSKL